MLAGAAKARRPDDTATAMAAVLRTDRTALRRLVRTGAAVEAALGVAGLVTTAVAPLVAVSYAVFTGYVAILRRRGGPLATCGCFGRRDTPATAAHVVLTAVRAVAAAGASSQLRSVPGAVTSQVWSGVPLLAVAAVGLWLSVLVLTTSAEVVAVRRMLAEVPRS